ncbi:MAG TPA: ABC transporter permease [Thermoanaerobaculia bacterium]|nr:ABC transporter permease [Thermoanaerobaculia bacterium]
MEGLLQDLRFALRVLFRKPVFAAISVLSLTLGIGANTAIFSMVNELFLRPLPIAEPQRVMSIFTVDERAGAQNPLSHLNWKDLREQSEAFSHVAGYDFTGAAIAAGTAEPTLEPALLVSGDYFETLGVRALRGRFFAPEEDSTPGAHPVVVLHHRFWNDRLGGAVGAGDSIRINGQPFTVIGIAPPGFDGVNIGFAPALWAPMAMNRTFRPDPALNWYEERRGLFVNAVGRLAPGVDAETARAHLEMVAQRLERDYPNENQGRGLTLQPIAETAVFNRDAVAAGTATLAATVGLVLLIACANVANLLLARATERRREVAIRLAMGVTRARLVRQLVTESLVVALAGGGLGLGLAFLTRGWLVNLFGNLPVGPNLDLDLGIDARVLAFTVVLSLATGFLFGLLPAIQASRADLVSAIKDQGEPRPAPAAAFASARNALVVVQLALAVVALVGAGLFVRSLAAARQVDLGYDIERLAVVGFDVGLLGLDRERGEQLFRDAKDRIGALPGVTGVALSQVGPLQGTLLRSVLLEGQSPEQERTYVQVSAVGAGYFETLGVAIEEGRAIDATDREGSVAVVVVNRAMADRYWPGENAVGRRFRFFGMEPVEVVGVAEVLKYNNPGEDPQPYAYLPFEQHYVSGMNVLARTAGDPGPVLLAASAELRRLAPDVVLNSTTGAEAAADAVDGQRSTAALLSALGGIALVLASIGIYGVMSYAVRRRSREIGIRMAMGARATTVLRMVLAEGLALAAVGLALGIALALAVTRLLTQLLFVSPTDPLAFAGTIVLLLVVAILACLVPAWRAATVNPAIVLRWE